MKSTITDRSGMVYKRPAPEGKPFFYLCEAKYLIYGRDKTPLLAIHTSARSKNATLNGYTGAHGLRPSAG